MTHYQNSLYNTIKPSDATINANKVQSLQDKIGATALQIREAIEVVGFDRVKVEQYLIKKG
jgi:hypothetical protein